MAQFKKREILPKLVDKQVMHFPGPRFEISPRAKKVKFQHLLPLTYLQCDRKGQFFKVLGYTFSYNSRPECLVTFLAWPEWAFFKFLATFWAILKNNILKVKNGATIFWAYFGNILASFYSNFWSYCLPTSSLVSLFSSIFVFVVIKVNLLFAFCHCFVSLS